jgi:histidyl-tRNA synthetase
LLSNPLRVLDSKVPETQALLAYAPSLSEFVSPDTAIHYEQLKDLLTANNVCFTENQRLVRGLDYYNNLVFEWITDALGSQGTVCAGGRYDSLVAQLGGRGTPAVGLAFGMERLVLLLQENGKVPDSVSQVLDVYVLYSEDSEQGTAIKLAEGLRRQIPGLRVQCHTGGGKFANQLKRAFASGASVAVIVDAEGIRWRRLSDDAVAEPVELQIVIERLRALVV